MRRHRAEEIAALSARCAIPAKAGSGQAVIFILMALAVLCAIFLRNVDLHLLVTGKTKAQNAGDAASLAAASWQGKAINLVGELNVMHAAAICAEDALAVESITNMQARLCFAGPLTALRASQAAAKKNGAKSRNEFTRFLLEHAKNILKYGEDAGGEALFPEPYPGAWQEYHDALVQIANDGIAAAPDNAKFYGDATGGHILLDRAFYDAVAGRNWCWFYLYHGTGDGDSARTILDDFSGHGYFGPVPPPDPPLFRNSEIFGLGLSVRNFAIAKDSHAAALILESLSDAAGHLLRNRDRLFSSHENWYVYDGSVWKNGWPKMAYGREDFLPLTGSVREECDYSGADAVTRLYVQTELFSAPRKETRDILWTSASKPFGNLPAADEGKSVPPFAYGIVLPAFRDVRLIPVDAATSGGDGAFDLAFRTHAGEHLPLYAESGALEDSCRYCALIRRFEMEDFRKAGSDWLKEYRHLCTLPAPSGGGHGGGTRRGH